MIRLFIDADLSPGAVVAPDPDQARYLTQVMRLKAGDPLLVFNGRDGEWRGAVAEVLKRGAVLRADELARPQTPSPDVELVLALIRKGPLEFAVEKATELGVRRIRLAVTRRTQGEHLRLDRLDLIAREAAEQCERLDVPEIVAPMKLEAILAEAADRRLLFCDETGGPAAISALAAASAGPWSILIGPEGGFAPEEREALLALANAIPVSLGPRILRAETAALAALTLWQATVGDWTGGIHPRP
jgi:16S rRNA (uracil1498-N3)-methyltransferase